MPVRILYFAWVRERVGIGHESIELPAGLATISDLIGWLQARGENYAAAFEKAATIRAAIDQTHVPHSAAIAGAREIAFFPPVTGG